MKMKFGLVSIVSLLAASLPVISLVLSSSPVEAKPFGQNQVKFRRLPPKEFSAQLGSSITIECEAGGSPQPNLHWLRNGLRVSQNELDSGENQLQELAGARAGAQVDELNQIGLSSTRSRLFIDCASYQDEAVYTCVAENPFSRIAAHTKLNLISPQQAALAAAQAAALALSSGNSAAEQEANELAEQPPPPKPQLEPVSMCGRLSAGGHRSPQQPQRTARQLQPPPTATTTSPQQEPLRIHMWTHNIVEVMKNSVILYCRSNANKRLAQQTQPTAQSASASQVAAVAAEIDNLTEQQQEAADSAPDAADTLLASSPSSPAAGSQQPARVASVSWTLPDDTLLASGSVDSKGKYEILETGDLLIRDLRWSDMGSYVCTVSDNITSDSVSSFVYPASVRSAGGSHSRQFVSAASNNQEAAGNYR